EQLVKLPVGIEVSWPWMRSLADLYQELGDVLLLRYNDPKQALAAFKTDYELRQRLTRQGYGGPSFLHDLAWTENKLGDVAVRIGDDDEAMRRFRAARKGIDELGESIWNDLLWPEHLAVVENNIGLILRRQDRFEEANSAFLQGEAMLRRLVARD